MGIKSISIGGRSDIKEVRLGGGVLWKKITSRWEYPVKTGDTLRITQVWNIKKDGSKVKLDAPHQSYTLELSGIETYGFELDATIPNPDADLYDGVYKSNNYNINSSKSAMKITFSGYSNFVVYIRSFAEGNYDYSIASTLDASSVPIKYNNPTTKSHTRGNQNGGTLLREYTKVEYPNDGGEHFIYIVYIKNSSNHKNDDRGYVLIER